MSRLTSAQVARREADLARIDGLKSAFSESVADSMSGYDCNDRLQAFDSHDQRECDLLSFCDDDLADPAYRDWCEPARLIQEFADPDLGVRFLREHDPEYDPQQEIYLTEKQENNRFDRIMVEVPKGGRRTGGMHGLPPKNRRRRSAKIVNEQLLRWDSTEQENEEAEALRRAVNAKLARQNAYILLVYTGKYRQILELFLAGKTHSEIVAITGKSERRIRQVINGDAQKGRKAKPGLREFCLEMQKCGVPASFRSAAPVPGVAA